MGKRRSSPPGRHFLFASTAVFLLGLTNPFVTAGANAYLDALKAEASSDTSNMQHTDTSAIQDGRFTPRTDDQPQMEQWLRENFVGSYTFYQKLSDTKKMAIYRSYRAGAPISEIRDKIRELLTQ